MIERICYIWAWHLVIITDGRLQIVLHSRGWRRNGPSDGRPCQIYERRTPPPC
jgi:hypothetical protein